jgi:hypothetical protein
VDLSQLYVRPCKEVKKEIKKMRRDRAGSDEDDEEVQQQHEGPGQSIKVEEGV